MGYLELISVCSMRLRVQLQSFACGYTFFPTPFVEKTALSPLSGLGTLVENHLTIFVRVYSQALRSLPLVCVSVLMPAPHYLDYWNFVVSFEIRKCETSNFIFFKIVLAFWGSLKFL